LTAEVVEPSKAHQPILPVKLARTLGSSAHSRFPSVVHSITFEARKPRPICCGARRFISVFLISPHRAGNTQPVAFFTSLLGLDRCTPPNIRLARQSCFFVVLCRPYSGELCTRCGHPDYCGFGLPFLSRVAVAESRRCLSRLFGARGATVHLRECAHRKLYDPACRPGTIPKDRIRRHSAWVADTQPRRFFAFFFRWFLARAFPMARA